MGKVVTLKYRHRPPKKLDRKTLLWQLRRRPMIWTCKMCGEFGDWAFTRKIAYDHRSVYGGRYVQAKNRWLLLLEMDRADAMDATRPEHERFHL